ncbi:hypothetical protein ACFOVU_24240 [Nocardiopsis sediminis]|uniref:Uncharacterized protein n=1 Tax=Nocardiopsis sediminis TaxID=1778267 RepID=A0ABV8FSG6_9ACTN
MTTTSGKTPATLSTRVKAGLFTVLATAGMGLALAVPAAPASAEATTAGDVSTLRCDYYLHAGTDYAEAWGYVDTCGSYNQVRAYARHGNVSALTAWYTRYARAYVDSGTSSISQARVDYR